MRKRRLQAGASSLSVGVVALLLVIGLGAGFFAIHRLETSRSIRRAREQTCFPLEAPSPLVYRITKQLTRRILDDKKPEFRSLEDAYFTRVRFEAGPTPGRTRLVRTEKCATLEMVMRTISASKEETLFAGERGLVLGRTGEEILPFVALQSAVSFSLTFGKPSPKGSFYGWPLLEEIGMAREEVGLVNTRSVDDHAVYNPIQGESVTFYQQKGDSVSVAGRDVACAKIAYSGQKSVKNVFHRIEGAVFLAPKIGIVKEERDLTMKVYPEPIFDAEKNVHRYLTRSVTLFKTHTIKLLVQLSGGR